MNSWSAGPALVLLTTASPVPSAVRVTQQTFIVFIFQFFRTFIDFREEGEEKGEGGEGAGWGEAAGREKEKEKH